MYSSLLNLNSSRIFEQICYLFSYISNCKWNLLTKISYSHFYGHPSQGRITTSLFVLELPRWGHLSVTVGIIPGIIKFHGKKKKMRFLLMMWLDTSCVWNSGVKFYHHYLVHYMQNDYSQQNYHFDCQRQNLSKPTAH